MLYVYSSKILESTFLLKVEKFNRIQITISNIITTTIIAYDGPNSKFPKTYLKKTTGIIKWRSSLFYCYVLVVQEKENTPSFHFNAIPSASKIKLVILSDNSGKTITLPNNHCALLRGTLLCLMEIYAIDNVYINLTKTEESIEYDPCGNSDISIYDINDANGTRKYSELTMPCSTILSRSLYSSGTSMLFAANLNVNTTVNFAAIYTTCTPLFFNPFMLLSKCYLDSPCVRKQFSRGF